jgi:hypothetical protein
MHGYLTRDGENPLKMLRMGREEVRGDGGRVVSGTVVSITRLEDGRFRLIAGEGTIRARRDRRCHAVSRLQRRPEPILEWFAAHAK